MDITSGVLGLGSEDPAYLVALQKEMRSETHLETKALSELVRSTLEASRKSRVSDLTRPDRDFEFNELNGCVYLVLANEKDAVVRRCGPDAYEIIACERGFEFPASGSNITKITLSKENLRNFLPIINSMPLKRSYSSGR